jgi:hypothetical protein
MLYFRISWSDSETRNTKVAVVRESHKLFFESEGKMGCPALGIWVGFLKQPALPGEAPPPKKIHQKQL